jgi:HTH-type transcriptional regulator, transcriptional repressor of NAD biosynthesis genes
MTTGMLLGKFLPPHLGHVYLVEFARHFVDRLTVVVCSLQREPIPGVQRHAWMRELFPFDHVVHLTDELPQEPAEHPDFWALWRAALLRVLPWRPDYVFASEAYGQPLAEVLGGRFVAVDPGRTVVPCSGTAVRSDPMTCWDYLPRCVRPWFVRRICVFGPESTGKSTLARRLAEHFHTVCVPEYARTVIELRNGQVEESDMMVIARGQVASEEALARNANRVLICDTDARATCIWSEALFSHCPADLRALAGQRRYDLYLLLDVDVPWVADVVRYLPDNRRAFFDRCETELRASGQPYIVIRGDWEQRFTQACRAVEEVLARPARSQTR